MKILIIDNYDSFVYNLKQMFCEANCKVDVVRNDAQSLCAEMDYDAIVLSPGPGLPDESGMLKTMILKHYHTVPILGICLGMQAIGEVFGGQLKLLNKPFHGVATKIKHKGEAIFNGVAATFKVGRYHSWVVDKASLPPHLRIISSDQNGEIMALKHNTYPIYGFQFHPESVLTTDGRQLINNFLTIINHGKHS